MRRHAIDRLQGLFKTGRTPMLVELKLKASRLAPGVEGLRIGQLSDLHLGPNVSVKYLQRAVKLLMEKKPDLIVLTGDFVSRSSHYAKFIPPALEGIAAPLGVYAVRGNHDHWVSHPKDILDALEQSGARVLINRGELIEKNGTALWLAGIDDVWVGQHNLAAALHGAPPEIPHLLLCHEPDYATEAVKLGVQFQLSGHTHGGQIRLAGRPLLRPMHGRNFVAGLYAIADGALQLYVNRGIGAGFPPIRWGVPPEITLIEIVG